MYGKKRGHRRTGSKTWGSVGEALFFGVFLLLGSLSLTLLWNILVVPEWRVNHDFEEGRGVVRQVRLDERPEARGMVYRPAVRVEYQVAGQTYDDFTYDIHFHTPHAYSTDRQASAAPLDQFRPGDEIPIWYNPADPREFVVVRGYTWLLWFLLLLPVAFILIGGVGLALTIFHWGKSVEHRVATTQMARRLNPLKTEEADFGEFPNVPHDANITNSPGTRLKYRLPIDLSRGWRLLGIFLACLFWNGIVTVFVILAINSHLQGRPEWLLTVFVLPFAAVGIAMIYFVIRELLVTTGVGPTQLEISAHPLRPGGKYEVLVLQGGRLTIDAIDLLLVCDEVATYRQGTDTRTDRARVYSQPFLHREQIEVLPQMAFEDRTHVEIPAECMHSFKADHNEVQWKLIVRGDIAGWPPFERAFPVIVCPKPPGAISR